jgi:hypothetical protein
MYRGLLHPRIWTYWHSELKETTWPLQERNLTYAGRLATFVGLYIDAFGEPPEARIALGERTISYSELSERLHAQMTASPTCGVSCYRHESMVMCNAHMLINNVLHDRLFGTRYGESSTAWLRIVDEKLTFGSASGPLFFYGTKPNSAQPATEKRSLGADVWALFLMSGVVPAKVRQWFAIWRGNITCADGSTQVQVSPAEREIEFASNELSSAWAFCLAKELGEVALAFQLRESLDPGALAGFEVDPLISGLYLLGELLDPGAFYQLINGVRAS